MARCVHELVSERVFVSPNAPAISKGGEVLTYLELEARSDRLSARLRAAGAGTAPAGKPVVAVLLERSPDLIVTLLAVLRAGAAYLALDPQHPRQRQAQLIRDAGTDLAVATSALRNRLPVGVRVVEPGQPADRPGVPGSASAPSVVQVNPDDLAYVSYTSGSTGEPKGVGVPHRAVSRLVRAPNWIDIRPDDVFLQLAPVAFDASTLEIWAPLVRGCRLAIAPSELDLGQLARTLEREQVTILWLTAGLFHQMVDSQLDAFRGLRHVIAGGDVISPSHLNRLLTAHPHLTFTNGYGPTENTTFTACWTSRTVPATASVPIGRPVTGTDVAVLDPMLRPVPPGIRGELYVAGEGLARGYLNRPAATAERFLPDTFTGRPGARMYRTGDLVRWASNGTLEFLGRADQQVKVNGFRVEPGHIETELVRLPEVGEAAVIAQPDGLGGKRLLAYVVLSSSADSTSAGSMLAGNGAADAGARIRDKLRARLPAYMVPWAILIRAELPLGRNGKVNRRALPAGSRVPRNVRNEFVAPRSAAEWRLAELWGGVLGIEPIGVQDNFFDLGGHSLLVADLLGTVNREFNVDISARVLYLQPTIGEIAAMIGKQHAP